MSKQFSFVIITFNEELHLARLLQPESLATLSPTEGLSVTHGESANGGYAGGGLLSNYTLIIDELWPVASDNQWRSLLQTDIANLTAENIDWQNERLFYSRQKLASRGGGRAA